MDGRWHWGRVAKGAPETEPFLCRSGLARRIQAGSWFPLGLPSACPSQAGHMSVRGVSACPVGTGKQAQPSSSALPTLRPASLPLLGPVIITAKMVPSPSPGVRYDIRLAHTSIPPRRDCGPFYSLFVLFLDCI